MEAVSVQQERILADLDDICTQQQKQLTKVNMEMENHTHELRVQIEELKSELETLRQSLSKAFQTT